MSRTRRGLIGSGVLFLALGTTGAGLGFWKYSSVQQANAASANQPEPMEVVTTAVARSREYRASSTSIGTVLAMRSITLKNELSGTVRHVALVPGEIVEAGTVLVALDVSVEEAELRAHEAEAALAKTLLERHERAIQSRASTEVDVDRARSVRDVAAAQIARAKAVIERKTIRAPFRARVGMADIHPGQYLEEGALITTLQGVDDAVHVDFNVSQSVAAGLKEGDVIEVFAANDQPVSAAIVAIDARVDPKTRNAAVRAKIADATKAPSPGASVRVRVGVGESKPLVTVPVSALRKGPGGDHVFVLSNDDQGKLRARMRNVVSGSMLGDDVLIYSGVSEGERVAVSGSFKLRENVLVAAADAASQSASK